MSNVTIAEVSMGRCLQNLPDEILFEIFRMLPKDDLIVLSRVCSRFRDIAGDTRLWKDVCIKYAPNEPPTDRTHDVTFDFEELYSEPWPVELIDLSYTKINPSVSSQTGQVVKVTKLDLSNITANKATMEAILTKYQCTELCLDFKRSLGFQAHIMRVAPEAFSKQKYLRVLSLRGTQFKRFDIETEALIVRRLDQWLAPVLSKYLKNLIILDLSYTFLDNLELLGFVKNLPTSLGMLYLAGTYPEDDFFKLLAESVPNLRFLELCLLKLDCPSLLTFQLLGALSICPCNFELNIDDFLYTHVTKFPALTLVLVTRNPYSISPERDLGNLRIALEPHGIDVEPSEGFGWSYDGDGCFWEVTKIV